MNRVVLKAEKLCKSFVVDKKEYRILRDIDLDIEQGEFAVIMGSSGSGKSTLLYSLSGMDEPSSGNSFVLGKNLRDMGEKERDILRRENISFIFQGIHLIPELTVYENVAAPAYKLKINKAELKQKIMGLLEKMELSEQVAKYPSQLSGGQKQRVAICRSLVNDPQIIFGDEPTGALNSSQGEEVLKILTELNHNGQTIVLVTHDVKVATRATKLLYIKDGKIGDTLLMDKYQDQEYEARHDKVFRFLQKQGW